MRLKRTGRLIACGLAIILCISCAAGCDRGTGTPSCEACADAVLLSQQNMPEMMNITSASDGFADWLQTSYEIDPTMIVDGAAYYTDGTSADEIAVLRCASSSDVRTVTKAFEAYVDKRRGVYSGYAPDAEHMLAESLILKHSDYAALLVCPSPSAAELAFDGSFDISAAPSSAENEESASASPTVTATAARTDASASAAADADDEVVVYNDAYDHDAVLAAWQTGDPTSLSAQNRAVYDAAAAILQQVTNDSMQPYQKELVVHDWMVNNIEYDGLALARDDSAVAPPESSTPYGTLVLGQGICYGYSSTFRLLMDMLGIECITVDGTINAENEVHSWNMVNLDGQWYLVDVTWDDPVNAGLQHTFFNRSEDEFEGYNRKWDRDAYPRATGGPLSGEQAM